MSRREGRRPSTLRPRCGRADLHRRAALAIPRRVQHGMELRVREHAGERLRERCARGCWCRSSSRAPSRWSRDRSASSSRRSTASTSSKVVEKQAGSSQPLEAVRAQIQQTLASQIADRQIRRLMEPSGFGIWDLELIIPPVANHLPRAAIIAIAAAILSSCAQDGDTMGQSNITRMRVARPCRPPRARTGRRGRRRLSDGPDRWRRGRPDRWRARDNRRHGRAAW